MLFLRANLLAFSDFLVQGSVPGQLAPGLHSPGLALIIYVSIRYLGKISSFADSGKTHLRGRHAIWDPQLLA